MANIESNNAKTRNGLSKQEGNVDADSAWDSIVQALATNDLHSMARLKEGIDTLLVFAGLLSAVLTAFVIDSYKALRTGPSDETIAILRQISAQLHGGNSTPPSRNSDFQTTTSALRVNCFWFLALAFSLFTAFVALLAKQWMSEYMSYAGVNPKREAVFVRQWRSHTLENWKVDTIVSLLPIFLQLSLLLFFAGIIDFLWHLEQTVAIFITSVVGVMLLAALVALWLPVFFVACAYRTPANLFLRQVVDRFRTYPSIIYQRVRRMHLRLTKTMPRRTLSNTWSAVDVQRLRQDRFLYPRQRALLQALTWAFDNASTDQAQASVERSVQDLPFLDNTWNPLECALKIVENQVDIPRLREPLQDRDSRWLRRPGGSPFKMNSRFSLLLSALEANFKALSESAAARVVLGGLGSQAIHSLETFGALLDWELGDLNGSRFAWAMWSFIRLSGTQSVWPVEAPAIKALCHFFIRAPLGYLERYSLTRIPDNKYFALLMQFVATPPPPNTPDKDIQFEAFTLLLLYIDHAFTSNSHRDSFPEALFSHFHRSCLAIRYRLLTRRNQPAPSTFSAGAIDTDGPSSYERFSRSLGESALIEFWNPLLRRFLEGPLTSDAGGVLKTLEDQLGLNEVADHQFWATQPVMREEEWPDTDGSIRPAKPIEDIPGASLPFPQNLAAFEWTTVNPDASDQLEELRDFLLNHYVTSDDGTLRFHYTFDFLQWALKPPGYYTTWHVGVREKSSKKLVAFISGVPVTVRVRSNVIRASEVNFLCVDLKFRSKGLTPLLIQELARQVELKGISQAIYTAAALLPTPVATCRYYHRALNIQKLIDTDFMSPWHARRFRQIPSDTSIIGLREAEDRDIDAMAQLYEGYMKRFDMAFLMTREDCAHHFFGAKGTGDIKDGKRNGQTVWAYVVEHPETHKITDFFSFYRLSSQVLGNQQHSSLEVAYLYYYASDIVQNEFCDQDGSLRSRLDELIGDALVIAQGAQFDVFNALTQEDNCQFLDDLGFSPGDGLLHFYLYNWRTAPLTGLQPIGSQGPGVGVGTVLV